MIVSGIKYSSQSDPPRWLSGELKCLAITCFTLRQQKMFQLPKDRTICVVNSTKKPRPAPRLQDHSRPNLTHIRFFDFDLPFKSEYALVGGSRWPAIKYIDVVGE